MPFTPFHLGVGALAKSIAPKRFSFQVFLLSTVLMDIEPGLGMVFDWDTLHGPTHTWLGACLLALLTYAAWRAWERYRPQRFTMPQLGRWSVALSALFGTYSHVVLDATMHHDMAVHAEWAAKGYPVAHLQLPTEGWCVAAAMLALFIFVVRRACFWAVMRWVRRPCNQR